MCTPRGRPLGVGGHPWPLAALKTKRCTPLAVTAKTFLRYFASQCQNELRLFGEGICSN